jgi:hypothetical protein
MGAFFVAVAVWAKPTVATTNTTTMAAPISAAHLRVCSLVTLGLLSVGSGFLRCVGGRFYHVLEANGSVFTSQYSKGYAGKRYYGGQQ